MFGWLKRNKATDTPSEERAHWENSSLSTINTADAKAPKVTTNSLFSTASGWQGLSMISADCAKLPLIKYELIDPDRSITAKRAMWDDPVQYLVSKKPNERLHGYYFWRQMFTAAPIYNQALAWIRRENGVPVELIPLVPCMTYYDPSQGLYFTAVSESLDQRDTKTKVEALFPEEVFHIVGVHLAGHIPETILHMRKTLALAFAAEDYNIEFFASGGQSSGILEVPASMTQKAKDNLEEGFSKRQEKNSFFRTIVLRDGAKWHSTSVDPDKGQTHELRNDQVYEIARWLCLPPSKLGLSDSVSYNSRQEDNRAYFDQAIDPWLVAAASEADAKLLTEEEKESRQVFFEHDITRFRATDRQTTANVGQIELNMKAININEYRGRIGLNPIEGGDEYNLDQPTDSGEQARSIAPLYTKAIREGAIATIRRIHQESGRKTRPRFETWFRGLSENWISEQIRGHIEPVHQCLRSLDCLSDDLGEVLSGISEAIRSDCEECLAEPDRDRMRDQIHGLIERWDSFGDPGEVRKIEILEPLLIGSK